MNIDAQKLAEVFSFIPESHCTNDLDASKIVSLQVNAIVKPKVNVIIIRICFL